MFLLKSVDIFGYAGGRVCHKFPSSFFSQVILCKNL